jgi:translation initiation factor IF-3
MAPRSHDLGQKWISFPPASTAFIGCRVKLFSHLHFPERLWCTWCGRCHIDKENQISDPRINDRIRVPEVRLVGALGEQVGVVKIEDALRMAQEADLDLVEVSPQSSPPVAKLMDFGKFKYEAAQKIREARKNQVNTVLKTVRFGLKIDGHDYGTKKAQIEKFLKAGDKVKVMVVFRGREQSRPEMGIKLLQKLAEEVAEFGAVESTPSIDGRNMVMVIGPLRNKAEAKADAKKAADKAAKAEAKAETTEVVVEEAAKETGEN